jgi:hypothetical protein
MQALSGGTIPRSERRAIENEMHGAPVGDADVREADIRIILEQSAQGLRCAIVCRRTVLIGALKLRQTVAVDE